jgi:hypothetical protein
LKIGGEIPLILEIALKIAKLDGEIPPIGSKNMKRGDFPLHNRKSSPYSPRNELHSEFNRKISAYISLVIN